MRDGKYCKWPGCKRHAKQVHHIIPFSKNAALRVTIENGISLCIGCHNRVKGRENDFVAFFMTLVSKSAKEYEEKRKRRSK
jgi:5-methylcytosine-specific restriction endonuclease McrA